MEQKVAVHPRVNRRHPNVGVKEVISAWGNRLCTQRRDGLEADHYVAVGFDLHGRLLEMIAVETDDGWLVFHAMRATRGILKELGISGLGR
ncbi:MAG: hypothetical protein RR572_07115 [Raoultibacter sp.]